MKDLRRVSLPYSVYLDFCISCYSFALSNQCRAVYVEQKTALLPQLISFTVLLQRDILLPNMMHHFSLGKIKSQFDIIDTQEMKNVRSFDSCDYSSAWFSIHFLYSVHVLCCQLFSKHSEMQENLFEKILEDISTFVGPRSLVFGLLMTLDPLTLMLSCLRVMYILLRFSWVPHLPTCWPAWQRILTHLLFTYTGYLLCSTNRTGEALTLTSIFTHSL